MTRYFTVAGYGTHEFTLKRSKFLSQVNRAETEEDALAFIHEVKRLHRDATHNCWAYIVGKSGEVQKASDDGEPSGTAGLPILEVLRKRQLTETVVVVTRYFGGIKLGASGLIRAYGMGAAEGIDRAGMVRRQLMSNIWTVIDYSLLGKVQNQLQRSGFDIKDIKYLERVYLCILVPYGEEGQFTDWIKDITDAQCQCREGQQEYIEVRLSEGLGVINHDSNL